MEKLCVLFDAKICPAASFHDGINALMDGDVNDGMILRLCYCARHWVEANPVVIPLIDADYTR